MQISTSGLRSPERNVTVSLLPSASKYLLRMGFDPSNGARPLRRLIERVVVTELSKLLVAGDLPPNARVTIEAAAVEGAHAFKYVVRSGGGGEGKEVETVFMQSLEGLGIRDVPAAEEEESMGEEL